MLNQLPCSYLPDPFIKRDGTRIQSPEEWPEQAAYIRELAQEHMYGTWPGKPDMVAAVLEKKETVYFGKAVRETITLMINDRYPLKVEFIYPANADHFPVVVYNASRLSMRSPIERDIVVFAGYGIASYDREMIRADLQLARFGGYAEEVEKAKYPQLDCGDIMAWAWGSTVVADYLETLGVCEHLICTGHSRGGKAALCAGVFDERFDVVAPIESGCGGLGSARFLGTMALDFQDETKCETIGGMATMFPNWMNAKYADYGTKEAPFPIGKEVEMFPLDAHLLRSACAPRAVFDSEGEEDMWTNSFGSQLCRDAAQKVYDFLGVSDRNGFHMRPGDHDFNYHDWNALIDFCDIVFNRERKMIHPDTTKRVYAIDLKKFAPWA